jgi:hypothetical protein
MQEQYRHLFECSLNSDPTHHRRFFHTIGNPYAVLEYDKAQASVDSHRGTADNPQWLEGGCGVNIQRGSGEIRVKVEYSPSAEHETFHVGLLGFQTLNYTRTVMRVRE